MYVSIWYIMGTILWTAFVYLTGNFAVLFATGVNQANLNWMYVHNAVGLIFTPVGLALAYYFIPKSSNTPLYSHKLSMIGFWSLAFVYVWTGAHHMLHGPISQWLQTIAIVFSVMLLIPVWAVVYNFFATMKGQWHQLRDNVPLKFLMSGVVFYLLTCFQGPMHSLRTVNAIVSKTDWIPGHAHMAVLGAFSFFAIAGTYYIVPPRVQDDAALGAARQLELLVHDDRRARLLRDAVARRLLAGLAVEQPGHPVHRHGGRAQADLAGALLLGRADLRRHRRSSSTTSWPPSPPRRARPTARRPPRIQEDAMLNKADKNAGLFVVAALVLFFIGGLLTTVVPPLVDKSWSRPFENADPAKGPTGKLVKRTPIEEQGRAIYVREGCWYCHTQQTRTLLADTKRSGWRGVDSPISTPDEFVYDSPHMFGTKRTGPGPVARRRQVRHAVAPDALPQPAGPGAGLGDAAVPVDRRTTSRSSTRWSPTSRRSGAPRTGGPTTTTSSEGGVQRLLLSERLSLVPAVLPEHGRWP